MKNLPLLSLLLVSVVSFAQIGIGTTAPNSSAALDVTSTTKGLLPPRMTQVQMNAIPTPANGLIVFCTDCTPTGIYTYNSPSWSALGGVATATVSATCTGFTGSYCTAALSSVTYVMTITNNDFSSKTVSLSTADLTLSGLTGVTVASVSPTTATIVAGDFAVITYTLSGTPAAAGTLKGTWTKQGLTCSSTVAVVATKAVTAASATPTVCINTALSAFTHTTSGAATGIGTPTGLPAGVTAAWASNTITISGTPTASGTFNYTIPVNGCGTTVNATGTITVSPSPGNYTLAATAITRTGSTVSGFTANWTALSGATGYTLEYSTSGSGPWTAFASNPYTGTSAAVTGLNALFYYFRVTSIGGSCSGSQAQQIVGCGAYVAAGVYKDFACFNLGATDETLDPNVPVQAIHGNYYQWGRNTVVANASTSSAAIVGWNTANAANGAWLDANKTANDPCPTGFRVPTKTQLDGVFANNTVSRTGSWTTSVTNFGTAIHWGPNASTKTLTLPAGGSRSFSDGSGGSRGSEGYYWTSTENGSSAWAMNFANSYAFTGLSNRANGFSVRCVSE
jgi:uncharacterized protein (TIGR02145 family)